MAADRIGQKLGNYRLTKLLGRGAFAEVYLGEHIHLESHAAIKVPYAYLASRDEVETFRSEARVLVGLVHPHIVRMLDFGVEGGMPYLIMDFAPKGTLRQCHPQGSVLSPLTVSPYLQQIAEGVCFAHTQRCIHRDIKPENLLLGRHDEVLVSDFGLALFASTSYGHRVDSLGTAVYMAPEQLQGQPHRASDQYALGIVTYEWLTGSVPFLGTWQEIANQHLLTPPRPLRAPKTKNPAITPAIEQVVLRALAKDPAKRFPSIIAFAEAFEQACQPRSAVKGTPLLERSARRRGRSAQLSTPLAVSRIPEPSRLREKWLREGNARYRKGEYLDALEAYDRVIALEPTDAQAYRKKGYVLRELKRYQEALEVYEQAITYGSSDALNYYGKGMVLAALERPLDALAAYERALQLDPTFTEVHTRRGLALLLLKRYAEALLAFEQALASESQDGYTWQCKGAALQALARNEEAEQAYQRARELGYIGGVPR